jgi:hypothetical protein
MAKPITHFAGAADPTASRDEHSYIWTYSGRQVWPLDARVEDITIEDIAHALSNLCRFTGHTRSFYSVAQHSVLVMDHCALTTTDPSVLLDALLHDATEAFLNDLARPVKYQPQLDRYRAAEAELDAVIRSRFFLPAEMSELVKAADDALLAAEIRDLMPAPPPAWVTRANDAGVPVVTPLPPVAAKRLFMEAFIRLDVARYMASGIHSSKVVGS